MVISLSLSFFPFSLRGGAKIWFQPLPRNSIDSWNKCKYAFIGKYYPPAEIIQLRSNIMNFRQLDNEHVAQAWERMKMLVKNCPANGWRIVNGCSLFASPTMVPEISFSPLVGYPMWKV